VKYSILCYSCSLTYLITGYSILLFMNQLNFKFLQVPSVLFYTFPQLAAPSRRRKCRFLATDFVAPRLTSFTLYPVLTKRSVLSTVLDYATSTADFPALVFGFPGNCGRFA